MEYELFEGVIPAGEYGGGDVIVWDRGTWRPHETEDPAEAVRTGELHLHLFGERLRGRFALVHRPPRASLGQGAVAPPAQARRRCRQRLGCGGPPHVRPQWAHQRRGQGGTGPALALGPARRRGLRAGPWSARRRPDRGRAGSTRRPGPRDVGGLGRTLKVTNLDKELFPARAGAEPVTKRELLAYAARIAPVLLPYLRGRALNMHRYPDGAAKKGFWHKEVPNHAPEWVSRWHNEDADSDETQYYVVVDEPATLVWVAGFGALEWHPWTSPTDAPDLPSYVLFDIDPAERTSWTRWSGWPRRTERPSSTCACGPTPR